MFCGIACLLLANSIELLCTMTIKSENQCTNDDKVNKPKSVQSTAIYNVHSQSFITLHCIANSFSN